MENDSDWETAPSCYDQALVSSNIGSGTISEKPTKNALATESHMLPAKDYRMPGLYFFSKIIIARGTCSRNWVFASFINPPVYDLRDVTTFPRYLVPKCQSTYIIFPFSLFGTRDGSELVWRQFPYFRLADRNRSRLIRFRSWNSCFWLCMELFIPTDQY